MKIFCKKIVNPKNCVLDEKIISIEKDIIGSLDCKSSTSSYIEIKNSIAFPGLINMHDHLKYSWFEKAKSVEKTQNGQGIYINVYQWLCDLYKMFDEKFYDTKSQNLLFQLGIYKQIFSATTTVLNHSRHSKQVMPAEKEYINLYDAFERELVVQPELLSKITNHNSNFGQSIKEAHAKAVKNKTPFMIHVAEGVDEATSKEIKMLKDLDALTSETLLVHCINTDKKDIELIKKGNCNVVWCPHSSDYIIGKTANIPEFLSSGINVCIGTDSSCSGSENLLEELRYTKKLYVKKFGQNILDHQLFDMVTFNAAKALKMEDKIGKIEKGYVADIVIIDSKTSDPYADIINSKAESIIAFIHNGNFIYGDENVSNKFPKIDNNDYTSFDLGGRKKVIIGNPESIIIESIKSFNLPNSTWFSFIPKSLKTQH